MPILVLASVVFIILVLGMVIAYSTRPKKKSTDDNLTVLKSSALKNIGFHGRFDGQETPTLSKLKLLEILNIPPTLLKSCLQQLTKEELITTTDDEVKMTKFGLQYYLTFLEKKKD